MNQLLEEKIKEVIEISKSVEDYYVGGFLYTMLGAEKLGIEDLFFKSCLGILNKHIEKRKEIELRNQIMKN